MTGLTVGSQVEGVTRTGGSLGSCSPPLRRQARLKRVKLVSVMQRLGLADRPGDPPPLPPRAAATCLAALFLGTGLAFCGSVLLPLTGASPAVSFLLFLLGTGIFVGLLAWLRRRRRTFARRKMRDRVLGIDHELRLGRRSAVRLHYRLERAW